MRMVDHIVDHFAVDHIWSTNQQVNYSVVRLTKNCKWQQYKFPGENDKPKHHFNLQLTHYKMKPSEIPKALKSKALNT